MSNETGALPGCVSVPRVWEIAFEPRCWMFAESEHLLACPACRARLQGALAAVAERREGRKRLAALVLLTALARGRARSPFALPRPTTSAFDTGPVRDDGFVTYDFGDPELKAAVSREEDGRFLLHVEHRGRRPGDLVLALVKPADEGDPVWARWLVLRAGYQGRATAKAQIDETALAGDRYELFLDPVAELPPGVAEQVRESFIAARTDDPAAIASWQAWAWATLEAGIVDEPLHRVLEEICDAPPAGPADERRMAFASTSGASEDPWKATLRAPPKLSV